MGAKLAAAQAASKDSLGSDIVYGLALAATHDREAARATAILAREGDLIFPASNKLVLPDPETGEPTVMTRREFLDPLTGEPVMLRRARAWFADAQLVTSIVPALQHFATVGVDTAKMGLGGRRDPETGRTFAIRKKLDPVSVAAYMGALDPLPGRVPFAYAINAAAHLSASKVDLARFRQALDRMVEWNGQTDTLSETQMIGMAEWWATNRDRRMRLEDVGPMYDPAVGTAVREALPPSYWLEHGDEMGAEVIGQIKVAADAAARSAEAYERYSDEIHTAVEGVLASEGSTPWRGALAALSWYDEEVLQRIAGAAWALGAAINHHPEEFNPGMELMLKGGDREAHRTFGDYMAETAGLDRGSMAYSIVSAGSEFAFFWYADPTIVGGKFLRGWQLGRLVTTGTERTISSAGMISELGYAARTAGRDIGTRVEGFLAGTASARRVAGLPKGAAPIAYPTSMTVELVENADDPVWRAIANSRDPSEAAGITSRLTVAEEAAAQDAFAAQLAGKTGHVPAEAETLIDDIAVNGIREPLELGIDSATGRYFLADGHRRLVAARELGLNEVPVRFREVGRELAERNTLPVLDIRAPRMTEAEYLYRASMENPEAAARSYRGAFSSPGVDPRVTSFIQKWGREMYGGKVTFEAIEDTKDIFRVAIGARPVTAAGYRFRQAMDSGGLRIFESRVNGAVRKTIGRAVAQTEGEITPVLRANINVELSRALRSIGVDKSVASSILRNVKAMDDETLRIISRATKRDLRRALGLESAVMRESAINAAQFQRASGLARAHMLDLAERRAAVKGFLTREGQTSKGLARRLKQLVNAREYRDLVKPMFAEWDPATKPMSRFIDEIADTLVQHQRGGGLLTDLVSEGGLTATKGNLVAIQAELREVLGDELTELITLGVSTQAQLRTRLRQLLAGPGALGEGELQVGAQSVGIATYSDQLADLAGVQRVYPSSAGFLQVAHEARLGIKESAFWKARGMEWAHSFTDKNPPLLLNIEAFNASEQWDRWLRRMHMDPGDVDQAVAEFRRMVASRTGLRERQLAKYFQETIRKAYKAYGVPEEQLEQIMNVVRPHHNFLSRAINNREKIARAVGLDPMAEPPLETMLKNVWALPSPREMDVAMRRAFGRFGAVQRRSREMFGKAVADLEPDEWDRLIGNIKTTRILYARGAERASIWADHARNLWVAWQLLRPGWALKVLPDENFRSLVMLHDFFDRVSAVGAYAKVFNKLGIRGRRLAVNLMDGSSREFELQLPGLLPHEAMASQGLMHGSRLRSLASRQAQLARAINDAAEFITPASREFWATWSHMLNRRVAGSDLGSWIMKTLARDTSDGRMWTWERVLENARANPRVWQALRQEGEDVADVVARARGYVTQAVSTNGKVNIPLIQETLYGNLTPNALKKMFRNVNSSELPKLPSLELAESIGSNAPLLGNARDTLTDWLMRRPSDWLNRNPLFKAEYTREVERLISTQTAAGRRFTADELKAITAGSHPLALQARAYALDRELGTMFTYINNSRFSEAARHIFPFVSPYQEQFSVWGRLLLENPQIAPQTRLMLKLATDTGVVSKDERGEWVINAKALGVGLSALLLLHPYALAATAVTFGLGPAEEALGLPKTDWMIPVKNLNLFLANTFTIGNIPIPVPGLSPPAEFLMNKVAEQTGDFPLKANLVDYFSAFGTDFSVLPASWHRALTAVFGDKGFDPELFNSTKNHMADALVIGGFELVDAKGREIPGAAAELDRIATLHAREFLWMRALQQFVQPTSPAPLTESNVIRDEFFDILEEKGDFSKAVKEMQRRYPDSPNIAMLAIGYSLWNQPGPSIPPTMEATAILSNPEFAKAAREYPELAFFLIPSEFRDGTYDFEAAQAQLDDALRTINPPVIVGQRPDLGGQNYRTGVTGGRAYEYLRTQGWEQFFTIESNFKARLKATGTAVDEGSPDYEAIKQRFYDDPIDELQRSNYAFAVDFSRHEEPFLDEALQKLRTVSDLPIWRDTEMGKALREYFSVTDPMRQVMYDNNISSLDTASAEDRGLDQQYKDLVAGLEERFPEVWPYLDRYWLGKDFQSVDTHRDDVLRTVGADLSWIRNVLTPWEQKWNQAQRAITNADTQTEESKAYLQINRLSRLAQREAKAGPKRLNPQTIWWDTLTEHEQNETRLRVAQKPYVFLTTFERRYILGIDSPPRIEQGFQMIAEAKVTVNEAIDRGADPGETWDKFDRWVKEEIFPIEGMRQAIKQAKSPGYTMFRNLPDEWKQGSEGDAWKAVHDAALAIQTAFKGAEFVDDDEFRQVRVALAEYIQEWEQYSPDFKDHVNYLREISGDQLGDILMPELWWTLI